MNVPRRFSKFYRYCFPVFLFFCFLVFLFFCRFDVLASKNHKVAGWAWSENIGWLSLNCYNDGINNKCLQSDYGVDYDRETNWVSGWAWSEFGGWVCFGQSCFDSGLPDAKKSPDSANAWARITPGGLVEGWANWTVLGSDGWIKLLGKQTVSAGKKYSCKNCATLKNEHDEICGLCFSDSDPAVKGSGEICAECKTCALGTCESCAKCYQFGVGLDYSNNTLVGWSWGGNGNEIGFGWTQFQPDKASVTAHAPYVETVGGDVYAQKGIGSLFQAVTPEGKFNATYMLQSNGSIVHFSSACEKTGQCGGAGWVSDDVGSVTYPTKENSYRSELGLLDIKGLLAGQYGSVAVATPGALDNDLVLLGGKVYYAKNDFIVFNKTYLAGVADNDRANGTIIVRGDLTIKGNHYYSAAAAKELKKMPSVGWIVLRRDDGTGGNIHIDQGVTNLVGSFYAENKIFTGAAANPAKEKSLTVRGLLIARGFEFERNYADLATNEPAERVIYDGRVIGNPPPGFVDLSQALPSWE